jgi:hypothetical protein
MLFTRWVKHVVAKLSFAILTLLLVQSACYAEEELLIDAPEAKRYATKIVDAMPNTSELEHADLYYFYSGPFGWSKPEASMVVESGKAGVIRYVELKVPSLILGAELARAGGGNINEWVKKNSKFWVSTDKVSCPVQERVTELLGVVRKAIAEEKANAELDSSGLETIRLDGGYKHRIFFGTRQRNTFSYMLHTDSGAVFDAIKKLRFVVSKCAK